MVRRLLPLLVALGLGLAVLAAGLFALHGIFAREREDGRRALEERRAALEQYARQAVTELLRIRLEEARRKVEAAAQDPLLPDSELLLLRGGRQVLPRAWDVREEAGGPAERLIGALDGGGAAATARLFDEDDPFAERLRLAQAFLSALEGRDPQAIARSFRTLLSHRARYRVAVAKDAALMLWVMERFSAAGDPDPRLMVAVLRDGVQGAEGARLEGLQRLLLERRGDLGGKDLALLAGRLVKLAEARGVHWADFRERVEQRSGAPVELADLAVGRGAVVRHGWLIDVDEGGDARGAKVRLEQVVAEARTQMVARGLLDERDVLVARTPGPVDALTASLASPRMVEALEALESRYALKAGLLALTAGLALCIVALAALAQSRKARFLEQRSEFVATVSHELKTPLSAIRAMAETLERRVAQVPGAKDYPARIVREADGLTGLVENILTFNRLEKGRLEARLEPVALPELAESVVAQARENLGREVSLRTEGLEGLTVPADPELLRILLANLVHNACRYTSRTPVELSVAVARRAPLTLQVADNGVGIPEESWEQVFEEFRRLRAEGLPAKGGSGLGLAICRRIMRLHGGEIRVARSSPEGTTFELRFGGR